LRLRYSTTRAAAQPTGNRQPRSLVVPIAVARPATPPMRKAVTTAISPRSRSAPYRTQPAWGCSRGRTLRCTQRGDSRRDRPDSIFATNLSFH